MEYLSGVTVNQELSLPGLNDSFKTSILEDENKRLRQSLRRSRSVLGTPVTSICVAGAGFGLRAAGSPGSGLGELSPRHSRRESRGGSPGGVQSRGGSPGGLHTLRTDKKKNLGRAWRSTGFGEEAMQEQSTMNSTAVSLSDRGESNEWALRYKKLEKLVKMVLRPSLASAREEGEELKRRNAELEDLLRRQNKELDALRPAHVQLQSDYDALFARLPHNPPGEIATNTDVPWVDPADVESMQEQLEAAGQDLKSAQTHLAEQKFLAKGAEEQLQTLRCSTVDASKAGAVNNRVKELVRQLQVSRDNESDLRELLEAERKKTARLESDLDEAEERMDELEAELEEVKRLKQIAWKKMDEDARASKRVQAAAQSQFTAKLIESVNALRVAVVAPTVTINVNGAAARSFAKVPNERIERCIDDEVMPRFVRVFTEDTEDRSLAELVELGQKRAPTECKWLMQHVKDIRDAVQKALANADVLAPDPT
jgi:predicted  nucleic acid-binding Zn-ribbon protein